MIPHLRETLHRLQRGRCYLCGLGFSRRDGRRATLEHVRPRALGGTAARNRLLACEPCNQAKADRAPHPCERLYLVAMIALNGGRL